MASAFTHVFFSEWGLAVIKSELLWVWLPAGLCAAPVMIFRRPARTGARRQS